MGSGVERQAENLFKKEKRWCAALPRENCAPLKSYLQTWSIAIVLAPPTERTLLADDNVGQMLRMFIAVADEIMQFSADIQAQTLRNRARSRSIPIAEGGTNVHENICLVDQKLIDIDANARSNNNFDVGQLAHPGVGSKIVLANQQPHLTISGKRSQRDNL